MPRMYRVEFFKKLADSTGHEVEACQGTVEVAAASKPRAIDTARQKFAESEHVGVWSLRADYERVELLNAPGAQPQAGKQPARPPAKGHRTK